MTFPDLSGETIDLSSKGIRVKLEDEAGYFKVLEVTLPDLSENDGATALIVPVLGKEMQEVALLDIRPKYRAKLAKAVPYYNLPDQEFLPFLAMPDGRNGVEFVTRIDDNKIYIVDGLKERSYGTIDANNRWYYWFQKIIRKE